MNVRTFFNGSIGLIAVIGIASSCGRAPEAPEKAAAETVAPVAVEVASVTATSDRGALEIPATVESARKATISSRLSATIVELNHREGDRISAGQVLVRLDGDAASAGLAAAQAVDAAAVRDLSRAESLLAKGAATRNEVENASTAVARSRSAVVAAKEAQSYATLRAPFAGRISRKIANVGDSVNPGMPLLELEGDGGLEVVASVESSVFDRLRVGQKLDVRVDGVVEPVSAVIKTLAPSADPSTHRFALRADVPALPGVRAGLFARIALPYAGGERRLLVPLTSVLRRGGLTGVYVIRDGKAWLRWVAPGDPIGDSLEIRAGLTEGERVALAPGTLHDGAAIREGR